MTLELEGLTKVYKDKTALDDVSFSFTPGIYGLLGPNGAGKSTMMNLISDNLTPSKGRVLLDGRGIDELGSEYRKLLGYMPQQQNIYPELSLRRFLYFMASLKGLKKSEWEIFVIKEFNLTESTLKSRFHKTEENKIFEKIINS